MEVEKDRYATRLYREYFNARMEWEQLNELHRHALWYNFEVGALKWNDPWREAAYDSFLTLHGARYGQQRQFGRRHMYGCFPVYYRGPVRDAPPLPAEILLVETRLAREHMEELRQRLNDPYDWAPGGHKYEKLLRESPGVAAYEKMRSGALET